MTTGYWESTEGNFYLYLEAPLEVKNMIWGTGVTDEEAALYYTQFSTHHRETLEEFTNKKTNFSAMTKSEKLIFAGITADLNGAASGGAFSILEYKDSVDYVTSSVADGGLGYNTTNSSAANTPMAFEFMFEDLSQSVIDQFISDIQHGELEFHLSPERGAEYTPVPEPATMMLFGIGLLGIAGVSRRKKTS